MEQSLERELSNFIRVWKFLGPLLLLICFGMVLASWPERWLAWCLFSLALFFCFFTYKHTQIARRALQLVKHGRPEDCTVEIRKESGDSRDFIKGRVSRSKSGEEWDILFTPPSWKIDLVVEKPRHAEAYFESGTGFPLIVVIDEKYLWAERNPAKVSS